MRGKTVAGAARRSMVRWSRLSGGSFPSWARGENTILSPLSWAESPLIGPMPFPVYPIGGWGSWYYGIYRPIRFSVSAVRSS